MDFATYTLAQRVFMLSLFGLVAWVVPAVAAWPGYGRAQVSLGEYTAAYGSSRWFGSDSDSSMARVMRASLVILGILVAVPELIGLL